MKVKKCKDCGEIVSSDKKSGKYWCVKCKEVKEDYDERYRIVVMGKNGGKKIGRFNFINCMGRELEKLGHEIISVSDDFLYKIVPQYDFVECFHNKKPINIKQLQYEFDPDFIYIEQMYHRLDVSEITCPVIYQHREYTHFPDILDPDMLLASYHWRLRVFEFYSPYEYRNIPYKGHMCVAVDTDVVKPIEEKTLDGVTHIGLRLPLWRLKDANGPFARMVMDEQEIFWNTCIDEGYVRNIPTGLGIKDFYIMLGRCEALLYDAGRFAGLSRRLLEAMASKTICIVRVYTKQQEQLYDQLGLTDEMCFFVKTPEDVDKIKFTEEERIEMANKAYEWVTKNHTYKVRAKQLINVFGEFKKGLRQDFRFMNYSLKHDVDIIEGGAYVL